VPSRAIHVLLLEDNPHDVERFLKVMRECAQVSVASDGAEALDRVFRRGRFSREPAPDIIVIDLNVPLLNGHEVINVLKSNSQTRHIIVVVWTASDNHDDIHKALSLGACAYMLKKSDIDEYDFRLKAFADFWLRSAEYTFQPVA
jgi:CheY-like chemotaxis protein